MAINTKNDPYISVVIPSYNEAENIPVLAEALVKILMKIGTWEIIFVDDGSTDGTVKTLRALNADDERIRFISFSRNFGHQNALRAGLERARGTCIVTMDGDMQHPPSLLPEMVRRFKEGYDVVYTIRMPERKLSIFKKITSKFFYTLINSLSDIEIENGAADFRLVSRKALEALLSFSEHGIFWRGVASWIGFKRIAMPYEPAPRLHGSTKYTLRKMIRFATDGITSFSVKPLQITFGMGVTFTFFAFLYAIYALYTHFFGAGSLPGWTSLLVSVLFLGGIQLISLGILGEYIGKLFMEVKRRPHFIVNEESE